MVAGDLKSPTEFLELDVHEAKNLIKLATNHIANQGFTGGARQLQIFATSFYNYHGVDLGKEIKWRKGELIKHAPKKYILSTFRYKRKSH